MRRPVTPAQAWAALAPVQLGETDDPRGERAVDRVAQGLAVDELQPCRRERDERRSQQRRGAGAAERWDRVEQRLAR